MYMRGVLKMKKKLTVVVLALCAAIVLLIVGISTGSLEQLIGDVSSLENVIKFEILAG